MKESVKNFEVIKEKDSPFQPFEEDQDVYKVSFSQHFHELLIAIYSYCSIAVLKHVG